MMTGKVYLVGAGPGDPGLITQKGLESLAVADTIVYDRLLDTRLLDLASPEAERIYVGKTAGQHALEQAEINLLLVEKAKEGKTVVRLKGGDPFVLGRGGEEAQTLRHNAVAFEVVPGVSSAVAVPAYAGIPITHRGLASSFAVITGHEAEGKTDSSIKWEKLATGVDTLVILMGMQNLPEIVTRLVDNGRAPDTPVAVIQDGTAPQQKTAVGNLTNIVDKVTEQHLTTPAIIVVGEVVSLREKIRWFDNRPLFGKRILVTRARHQASTLSKLLATHGAQPVELPAIDIQPVPDTSDLDRAISNLKQYQWLVFTSVNGVEAFFQRLFSLKLDARAFSGLKIGAIGPATAEALKAKGMISDYVPEVYTGREFVSGLKSRDIAGQRFLFPRANIADKELVQGIKELGAEADEVTAYITVPASKDISRAKDLLLSDGIDVITFTSSSTVANLAAAFDGEKPVIHNAKVACIGPKTAEAAARAGLSADIMAVEQTIPGLVASIEQYFSKEV